MVKELLYKWFGLSTECRTCLVLERELDRERREKEILLDRVINFNGPKDVIISAEPKQDYIPVKTSRTRFIPHAVRQQMMEAEDRKTLEILQKSKKEINELEKLEEEVLGPVQEKEDASKIS